MYAMWYDTVLTGWAVFFKCLKENDNFNNLKQKLIEESLIGTSPVLHGQALNYNNLISPFKSFTFLFGFFLFETKNRLWLSGPYSTCAKKL